MTALKTYFLFTEELSCIERSHLCNQVPNKFTKWDTKFNPTSVNFHFQNHWISQCPPFIKGSRPCRPCPSIPQSQLPHAFTPCASHLSMSVWWRKMFVMILATCGVNTAGYCITLTCLDLKPVRSQVTSVYLKSSVVLTKTKTKTPFVKGENILVIKVI